MSTTSQQVTGTVIWVSPIQQVTQSFKKREVILSISDNPQYPQEVIFEAANQKADDAILNSIQPGHLVSISYNLRGRRFDDPQKGTKWYNTLAIWKIEFAAIQQPAQPVYQQAPVQQFLPPQQMQQPQFQQQFQQPMPNQFGVPNTGTPVQQAPPAFGQQQQFNPPVQTPVQTPNFGQQQSFGQQPLSTDTSSDLPFKVGFSINP